MATVPETVAGASVAGLQATANVSTAMNIGTIGLLCIGHTPGRWLHSGELAAQWLADAVFHSRHDATRED
jgi:hypothetical protein